MNAAIEHVLKFFRYEHLPEKLQSASKPFGELAQQIAAAAPESPETTVALRKLLEAKDAAVRAILAALLIALFLVAPARAEDPEQPSLALYAGRLITVNLDQAGGVSRGDDLYVLRMVAVAPGPYGLRVGFRGDLTALGYIDPSTLDLETARSAEGYGAISWSREFKGATIGPAAFAGGLVPIQAGAIDWRIKYGWGGGLRIGVKGNRSWGYVTVGKDAASDAAAGLTNSPFRLIAPFSVEAWRIAVQGEFVSGVGGRFRAAAVFRVPLPTWGSGS